eukprot:2354037-Heterocapsa_arctica.AAC.1
MAGESPGMPLRLNGGPGRRSCATRISYPHRGRSTSRVPMVLGSHGDSWPPGASGSPLLRRSAPCAGLRGRDVDPASI